MKQFALSSLRVRLVLMVVAAVLPALGVILYSALEERRYEATVAQEEALRLVEVAAAQQGQLIENAHQWLITASHSPQALGSDPQASQRWLADFLKLNAAYENLGLVETDGTLFASAAAFPAAVNLSDQSFFQRVRLERDFVIGDFQRSRITQKRALQLAFPILGETGQLRRVLFAGLEMEWFDRLAHQARLPDDSVFALVNRAGLVLAQYPEPKKWVGRSQADTRIVDRIRSEKQEGTVELQEDDRVPRLYAYAPLLAMRGEPNTFVYLGIPTAYAYANAQHLLRRNLLVLVVVTVLALGITWVASDILFLRYIQSLVKTTRHLAKGEGSAPAALPHAPRELGELAGEVNRMARTLQTQTVLTQTAQIAMSRTEARLQHLLRFNPGVLYSRDATTYAITFISENVYMLFGYEPKEFLNDPTFWSSCLHPDDVGKLNPKSERLWNENRAFYEYRFRHKNGSYHWLHDEAQLVRKASGKPLEIVGSWTTITERKRLEEAKLQTERLAVIGAMSAKLAHEIRNPLGSIILNLDLAKDEMETLKGIDLEKAQEAAHLVRAIDSEVHRLHRISEEYLHFARLPKMERERLRVAEWLQEKMELVAPTLAAARVELEMNLDELPPLFADQEQLWEALLNLIRNAVDAMPEGGKLTLAVTATNREMCIRVTDTGRGMNEQHRQQLFKPFFTTKFHGTGLGLSLVQQIVFEHGGRIECETAEGRGTTFTLYLPFQKEVVSA